MMNLTTEHIGELTLRRRRAGEALGTDGPAIEAHATSCAECRARARALDDEQRRFEQEISFDRFAAGVERAARAGQKRRRSVPLATWLAPVLAMAAAVALVVTFRPHEPANRTKGGSGIIVRVAGLDTQQRTARVDGVERLARGERLRIGYSGVHDYLLSLSIDEHGEVTPLYSDQGASLPLPRLKGGSPSATRYLPDGWELTGAGLERIIVVLSDKPIDVAEATRAARKAYDQVGGDLLRLPPLGLAGEEFSRTFAKP